VIRRNQKPSLNVREQNKIRKREVTERIYERWYGVLRTHCRTGVLRVVMMEWGKVCSWEGRWDAASVRADNGETNRKAVVVGMDKLTDSYWT
jgi:hypothetical protein